MSITSYECQACGWTYPPQDENSAIQSDHHLYKKPHQKPELKKELNTIAFTELANNFTCPLCGVGKSEFKPVINSQTDSANPNKSNSEFSSQTDSNTFHTMNDEVVIIGGGLAGWTVVDAIRAKDSGIGITLITADNGDRYHKPMLSVALSQNKTADDLIRASGREGADKAKITLLANTHVQSIDTKNRIINTNTGEVRYAKLVLAQGATPAIPSIFPRDAVWHVNDISNFDKIQQVLSSLSKPQHIAVVGAGMVGTEIAEDLTKSGHKVSLIDMNEAPLSFMLPSLATEKIRQALVAQGIQFYGDSRVDKVVITSNDSFDISFTNVKNNTVQTISVDHILVSTGLKVDETLPKSAGIIFDSKTGVVVTEATLQTSDPDVYAIGDCMSIAGVPCRYVAPLRAQATTIAEHIIGHLKHKPEVGSLDAIGAVQFQDYNHKPPMIRLKNKSISISATGTPSADEANGTWQVISDSKSDTSHEMVLEQVTHNGDVVATVTLKMPL